MRPITVSCGSYSAASATRFFNATPAGGGAALTLLTTVVDTTPRRLVVTPASQTNNVTLTVTGLGWGNQQFSETISIPSGSTTAVFSVLDYQSLVSIVANGAWTANVEIGTSAATTVGSSAWIRMDDYAGADAFLQVDVTGTISFTIEGSNDDCNLVLPQIAVPPALMTWICPDTTNLSAKSASLAYQLGASSGATGGRAGWLRLTANSYTGAGAATMTVRQGSAGGKF